MEWLLPYHWAAAFGSLGLPMTSLGSIDPQPKEPVAEYADRTALDLEVVRVIYEVLVQQADCVICGAPLDPALIVELRGGSFTVQMIVATHCRGWRRHRYVAHVVERNGELRFGQLEARDRTWEH